MVKETSTEYPKCASRWPRLLSMVKLMEDLPEQDDEEAAPLVNSSLSLSLCMCVCRGGCR